MTVLSGNPLISLKRAVLTGIVLFLATVSALISSPAAAEGTFLLQLGSYESDAEANRNWDEIKSKNPDVLGKMTLHIAEVALPPDNKVSYRTQAGPVATREQASALCNTLQNRGVDCYVVETALFTGESLPDQAVATAPSAAPAVVSQAPVAQALPTATASAASEPAPTATSSTLDPATSMAVPAPVFTSSVMPMASDNGNQAAPSASAQQLAQSNAAPADMPAQPALPPSDYVVPGRGPKFLQLPASMAPAPVEVASAQPAPAPPPPPAPAQPQEKPGFFSRLFGGGASEPASSVASSVGNVNVAEAIRVPLSEGKTPSSSAAPAPHPLAVIPATIVRGLGGSPSSDTSRTFWAQLSYFRDEYQARSFYQDFHAAYPQFSDGIRVRITRPYSYATTPGHVSLRVGPFAEMLEVRAICSKAVHYHLRCTVVRDLGSSPITGIASPFMAPSAVRPTGISVTQPTEYWVQLGTYHSNEEAMQEWKMLHDQHKRLLRKLRISVSSPTESSALGSLFRLRAGPFKKEGSATRLCESLKDSATGCIVLSDH